MKTLLPTFVFAIFASGALAADFQAVTVGVKGGVPITNSFTSSGAGFNFDTKRYTVGPTIEFHIPHGLGIEVDALYKRLTFGTTGSPFFSTRTTANSWEFPLLLKYRPGSDNPVHPYIAGGVSFRHLSGLQEVRSFFDGTRLVTDDPFPLENRFTAGFVIGGGIEFRPSQYFRIAPEFRYTRWGWENFRDPGGVWRSKQNQAEVLLGITF